MKPVSGSHNKITIDEEALTDTYFLTVQDGHKVGFGWVLVCSCGLSSLCVLEEKNTSFLIQITSPIELGPHFCDFV